MISVFVFYQSSVCDVLVGFFDSDHLPGPLPAIFGLNAATYILCELAERPILNPLAIKNRKKLYERMYRDLLHRESKLTGEQLKYVMMSSIPAHVMFNRFLVDFLLTKTILD